MIRFYYSPFLLWLYTLEKAEGRVEGQQDDWHVRLTLGTGVLNPISKTKSKLPSFWTKIGFFTKTAALQCSELEKMFRFLLVEIQAASWRFTYAILDFKCDFLKRFRIPIIPCPTATPTETLPGGFDCIGRAIITYCWKIPPFGQCTLTLRSFAAIVCEVQARARFARRIGSRRKSRSQMRHHQAFVLRHHRRVTQWKARGKPHFQHQLHFQAQPILWLGERMWSIEANKWVPWHFAV